MVTQEAAQAQEAQKAALQVVTQEAAQAQKAVLQAETLRAAQQPKQEVFLMW